MVDHAVDALESGEALNPVEAMLRQEQAPSDSPMLDERLSFLVCSNRAEVAANFFKSLERTAGHNGRVIWLTNLPAADLALVAEQCPSVRVRRIVGSLLDAAEEHATEAGGPKRVVCLASRVGQDDSEAILHLYGVGSIPGIHCTVEINESESIRFLTGVAGAAGRAQTSKCEAIRNELVNSNVLRWQSNAWFAAGCVLPDSLFDTFAAQCGVGSKNPRILEEILRQLAYGEEVPNGGGALLHSSPVPLGWHGAPFHDVFMTYLSEGHIAVALLRRHLNDSDRQPTSYLYSCPSMNSPVMTGDQVLFLRRTKFANANGLDRAAAKADM